MTRGATWKFLGSAIAILLFAAISANAAEEGGSAGTERANEIFKWINFAIVAGLIAWVFLKLTPPFFRTKRRPSANSGKRKRNWRGWNRKLRNCGLLHSAR